MVHLFISTYSDCCPVKSNRPWALTDTQQYTCSMTSTHCLSDPYFALDPPGPDGGRVLTWEITYTEMGAYSDTIIIRGTLYGLC